jgi:sec-independent protein translocase protein TatB
MRPGVFDLSIEKLFVLGLVALFVVGPERLPAAAAWLAQAIRQVKQVTSVANGQLRADLGPQLAELRGPLQELRGPLRELNAWRRPRGAIIRQLAEGSTQRGSSTPVTDTAPSCPTMGLGKGAAPPYERDAT